MRSILFIACGLFLSIVAKAGEADSAWLCTHYTKTEVYIPMKDGTKLFTAIYEPKDKTTTHPILINRTPYSIAPYGPKEFKAFWNTPYLTYFQRNYIIVLQDVRGRFMSEGEFMDIRPYISANDKGRTDESSDSYDTIEWLINNVANNNKKVGAYGISYPGFYATMMALSGHPALKAVSPQAPVTEWFLGDDFHHNGAFMLMDGFNFYSIFGRPRPIPTKTWGKGFEYYTKDNYKFFLELPTLKDAAALMGDSIKFWKDLYDHPNYDKWWDVRNVRNHVQHIPEGVATLVVGGLYDAEDCFGAWNLYKAIESKATNNNKIVMGPWSHGGWAKATGEYLGNVRFGAKTAEWYQQHIEVPFFDYYLRDTGNLKEIKEATIFFSGSNKWKSLGQWPPNDKQDKRYYFHADGTLDLNAPFGLGSGMVNTYFSDPKKPVPYTEDVHFKRTNEYMTDDQRFAARRPDVLVYQTEVLTDDLALGGPVIADLYTALSSTDADFVVKLIDVFPDDFAYDSVKDGRGNNKDYPMGGYQMLVRGEIMRGRYRNNFAEPVAFQPGKITEVKFKLPDVAHVFKKGHRVMIQVQSSWFPLADRNPQQFVDIYHCDKSAFVKCEVKIYCNTDYASSIILPVIGKE